MKLSAIRVAILAAASEAALRDTLNDFFQGKAIVGPPAYPAGFVQEQTFVDVKWAPRDATDNWTAMVLYTD